MITYWANPKNKHGSSSGSGSSLRDGDDDNGDDLANSNPGANPMLLQAHSRLVDWIVKLMLDDIKKIVSLFRVCTFKLYFLAELATLFPILLYLICRLWVTFCFA